MPSLHTDRIAYSTIIIVMSTKIQRCGNGLGPRYHTRLETPALANSSAIELAELGTHLNEVFIEDDIDRPSLSK